MSSPRPNLAGKDLTLFRFSSDKEQRPDSTLQALVLKDMVFFIGPRPHAADEDRTKLRSLCLKWNLNGQRPFPLERKTISLIVH